MNKNKKIGLALGGGAARGWAHIGAIKALEEAGIPISYVAGTSIGSLIGGVYASGKLNELESLALSMDWKNVIGYLDMAYFKNGLLDGEKVIKILKKGFIKKNIKNTQIPYAAVATELKSGKEKVFLNGDMGNAIRSSISIPGIFTTLKLNNKDYVDGGLVNPLPVSVVKKMGADIVIAVDLNYEIFGKKPLFKSRNPKGKYKSDFLKKMEITYLKFESKLKTKLNKWMDNRWPTIFDVIGNSVNIMQHKITNQNLKKDKPDFLIRTKLGYVQPFDFQLAEQVIDHGYSQTKKIIPKLKKLL